MRKTLTLFSILISPIIVFSQCLPPSATAVLDVNNVRVRMNNGGSSWWDLQSHAQYEVPKGSGKNSFFTGAFWIGGKDEFNQLHLAAVRFRQIGNDFWPGPITNGNITSNECVENDRIYKLNRWEVAEFRERSGTVGYVIPQDILEWPASGNPNSLAHAGAPFIDVNNDGVYNAYDGDYPAFAFDVPTDRDFHLLGDQCLWWVENDIGGVHTESGGEPMGVELQCMAYAFSTCDPLNDQTFYRYKVINKSSIDYSETYIGLWADADVGFAEDDYVQCEVMRHLGFAYNGFAIDGTGSPQHYGAHPPAAGIGILEGPLAMENDGVDNDRDGVVDEAGEHLMMSRFAYHGNSGGGGNPAQSNPTTELDYYNYMRGIWLDGVPMCYGAGGHPSSGCNTGIPCDFMFPGDSDPLGYGTGGIPQPIWTEQTAGNVPFDRRFLVSTGPFSLNAGQSELLHYGALWARDTTQTDPFAAAERLFEVKDLCQAKFSSHFDDLDCCPPVAQIAQQNHGTFNFLFSSMEDGDSFHWDFGDGSSSTQRFPPVHTYADFNTYDVCLTVTNDCGTGTVCEAVTTSPAPISFRLKRIEGSGNMARNLEFKQGMHDTLFVTDANRIYHPIYDFNKGPVRIEVLDSTLIPADEMFIALDGVDPISGWKMYPLGGMDTVYSSSTIDVGDAQLIPQWGLLVQVKQVDDWSGACDFILDCSVDQGADPWLTWLSDTDYPHYSNWIRSGLMQDSNWPSGSDYSGDPLECFENILEGTWAPWKLASHADSVASPTWKKFKSLNHLENLNSLDIVITSDPSKWTRCPVLEIADDYVPSIGSARRFDLRQSPSVDQNGNPDGSGTMGMSWFPGYAVNVETGERLNMAFGENSWLAADNGADMRWNPTSTLESLSGEPILGGGHYIYVFGHNGNVASDDVPLYDQGQFIFSKLSANNYVPVDSDKRKVYKDAMWVAIPMLIDGEQLLQPEVRIRLRVRKPYVDYKCLDAIVNQTHPLYSFSTTDLGTNINDPILPYSNVVVFPNPTSGHAQVLNIGSTTIENLTLYNTSGQLVFSKELELGNGESYSMDCGKLDPGIYFLVARGGKDATMHKLVVN